MKSEVDQNSSINIFRTLWHFGAGIVVFIFVYFSREGFRPDIWLLFSALVFSLLIDLFRLKGEAENRVFWKYLGFLTSGKDAKMPNASVFYALSLLACSLIYSREAMLGAVVCLALGDPAAIIIGKKFGRFRIKNKSIEGGLANFLVCLPVLIYVLPSMRMALAGAFAGAFIELMPLPIDDNITIPLFAGGAIMLAAAGI